MHKTSSIPSSPQVLACFKCMSALKTAVILMGGIGGPDSMCLLSQNSFSTHKQRESACVCVCVCVCVCERERERERERGDGGKL